MVERRWQGQTIQPRKYLPLLPLSTTNLTWTDMVSNPDLRRDRSATSRLSHGTAVKVKINLLFFVPHSKHCPFLLSETVLYRAHGRVYGVCPDTQWRL